MRLKPKNTALNKPALLYKRYIGLEKSLSLGYVYKTKTNSGDYKYWIFDKEKIDFVETTAISEQDAKIIEIYNNPRQYFSYLNYYFYYDSSVIDKWVRETKVDNPNALSVKFANVAKYQTHNYYYAGTFDYMIKGSIEGTTSSFVKGNVLPLTSMSIKYYTDTLNIERDDLLVINGRLFVVEDTEVVQKRMPKAFNIYSSTINNIL